MFVKLQHLDTNCIPILHSINTSKTKTSINGGGVSLPLPRRHRTEREYQQLIKKDTIPPKKPPDFHKRAVFHKQKSNPDGSDKNLEGESILLETCTPSVRRNSRVWSRKESSAVLSQNEAAKKMHTKCSTKWAKYGGCIPAILEALETVNNLDQAFKPWELSLSNKERSIILKEQKVWKRALEIFNWFKRKGCYELNVIHYNIMFRILGKARKWDELETLRHEMEQNGIESINSTYGTLIDVYSKGGIREKAMHWLDIMNKKEMEPDEVTMGIIVQMYKISGQFEKAEDFFRNWSLHNTVTVTHTYNTLIDTYRKAGRLNDAFEKFEQMVKEGIVPNTVTLNTIIHVFGNHGRLEEVESLMKQIKCVPDTRTYNILISLHIKHDNIISATEYFKKMKYASLEPDVVSYRTLLHAFSVRHMVTEAELLVIEMDKRDIEIDEFTQSSLTRMYIEANMVEKSWLWFNRFHILGKMSPECYSACIDAFGERGYVLEAEKVFKCCQERRNPSVLEFNVMIKAYGINKKFEEVCRLFDIMESMDEYGVFPDKCSYNSIIQMLANADLPQKARFYLRKMQESGLVIDCIPYCAVISSFVKLGQLENAVGLFEEMVGFGLKPDVVVYGVLINAYADVGNADVALHYVNEMKENGLVMNGVICNCLIKLYTKVGCLKEAEEAYYMLQRLDVGPDVYCSNCMIDLYTERSMVKPAEDIFEKLTRNGNANEFSYAMMLCMYKKIGSFDEAFEIAKQMRELGLMTDLLSYNHVLRLYASDGRFKEAVTVFREMIESGVEPNDLTFRSLGVVLMKRGVPKKAVKNLEVLWRNDCQIGLEAWLVSLNSVVGMVYHDISDQ